MHSAREFAPICLVVLVLLVGVHFCISGRPGHAPVIPADVRGLFPPGPGPQAESLVEDAAGWEVTGADDGGYNGTYQRTGTHNGQPTYRHDDGHWLWYCEVDMFRGWCLSAEPQADPAFAEYIGSSPNLPGGPWVASDGAGPAPVLTEVETLALDGSLAPAGPIDKAGERPLTQQSSARRRTTPGPSASGTAGTVSSTGSAAADRE